jgi:hypothetical protein
MEKHVALLHKGKPVGGARPLAEKVDPGRGAAAFCGENENLFLWKSV